MNMVSIGIPLFIVTVSYITANKAFVTVQCKTENTGQYGHKSLLECVVRATQEATNPQFQVVTWKKVGVEEPLVVFHRGNTKMASGYSFAEPSWNDKNMNVYLLITNTAVHDEGVYTCAVLTNIGSASTDISLKVTAKYNAPTIKAILETIDQNTEGTLVCESDGGYPAGTLRWFDHDGGEWSRSAEMEVKQTDKDLFQLTSKLTLLQGSIFSQYTCIVYNVSGGKEDEVTFLIKDSPEHRDPHWRNTSSHKDPKPYDNNNPIIIIIISVVSTLITMTAILLIVLGVKWRNRNRDKTTSVQQISKDYLSKDMTKNDLDSEGALGRSIQSLYNF